MKKTTICALLLCLFGFSRPSYADGPSAEVGATANPFSVGSSSSFGGSASTASPYGSATQVTPGAQQYGYGIQSTPGAQQYGYGAQGTPGMQQYGYGTQGAPGMQQYGYGTQGTPGMQQYGYGAQGTPGMQQYGYGTQGTPGMQQYGYGTQGTPGMQQYGYGAQGTPGMQQYGYGTQGNIRSPYGFVNQGTSRSPYAFGTQPYSFKAQGMTGASYSYGTSRALRSQGTNWAPRAFGGQGTAGSQYPFGGQGSGGASFYGVPTGGFYPVANDGSFSTFSMGDFTTPTSQIQPGFGEGAYAAPPMPTISPLEISMSSDGEQDLMKPRPFTVGMINQFGYNFFLQQSMFAPVIDAPVGPDYVIGPGDTLVVTTWGSLDGVWPLEVNRSGEIVLPRVGAVKVWGATFAKVPDMIRSSLSRVFKNAQVNVTMGKLRHIKVYLVGEVTYPGDYDLSSLSTVINALAAAGGPTKNGSLRSIQLLRAGQIVENIDLYDFFLKGDKSRDIRLQPGDTVHVPIIGKVAGISGNVRRPAIYELKNEVNLKDLIELAGGFNPSGYLNRLQISRVVSHSKKLVTDFSLDPKLGDKELEEKTKGITIQDLDLVKVFPIDLTVRDNVRLDGYVLRPGLYALKPGMRVKDLIGKDNYLPESYPDIVEITRLISPDFHPEVIHVSLDGAMSGNARDNILLTEFDNVRIFSKWEMQEMPRVRISGEVQKPGEYRVLDKMTLRDLVLAAGNIKKTAFLRSVELTRSDIVDGKVKSHIIDLDLGEALKGTSKDNILLKDMDEIVVRRLPDWKEETDRYVVLRGELRFPGIYPILTGEKLSSIIARAGGYTEKAYLRGAKFTRRSVAETQQQRMDEIIARAERDIIQKQQDLSSSSISKDDLDVAKTSMMGMKASLEKMKQVRAEGRISLEITSLDKLKNTPNDLVLQGGDTLEIPQSTNSIQVFGEVYNPTTIIQIPGKRLGYYLKKSGGFTKDANEDEMYVILADGTVRSRKDSTGFFSSDGFFSMRLEPGDTIVVPQDFDKISWIKEIKDIATIIGQLALAAGVALK